MRRMKPVGWLVLAAGVGAVGQTVVPAKSADGLSPLSLVRRVRVGEPFTVAGPRGVLVGQQEGTFEAWVLPVKLLSHFSLRAEVDDYPVPIELNPLASTIQVYPDRTVITYTHIALTVRQTMFAPETAGPGTGAVVLFEVDAVRPVRLTLSFTPEMRPMWPAPTPGTPSPEWVAAADAYVLHMDTPDLAGAVGMPGAEPGVMAPYQEKPQTHPVEFRLRFDPARDRGRVYPLLMAIGQTKATASNAALLAQLAKLKDSWPTLLGAQAAWYGGLQARLTRIETPDAGLDEAFGWAEMAVEQLRTRAQPEPGETDGTSLVAGYFASGDSARPGFGWFFGRDALYTVPAVDAMGDFALSRDVLQFLMHRQRADGKIMHEYSQTAARVDWAGTPYEFAAADATPLFLLAMENYVRASGDTAFLQAHAAEVMRAWEFERTHDSDGDGIYDNAQGTGWVEDWPAGAPHQEIYLALLDRQACAVMARLATRLSRPEVAREAESRGARVSATIEREYYLPAEDRYAFSRNADGSVDRTRTLFPALAWWAGGAGLAHPAATLRAWDSHDFSTDWGTRDLAKSDAAFDSMSYHRGSVWPLFTGWAAVADYRTGRALSGFAHLKENSGQTETQDLGAVTELLSGEFFTPFGRSTSHQLWSSAMVITPVLEGMFGLEVDAAAGTVSVNPQLPAAWPGAAIRNVHVGAAVCDVEMVRAGGEMQVRLVQRSGTPVRLVRDRFALPAVEVGIAPKLPLPGAETTGLKVLGERYGERSLVLELEAGAGRVEELALRTNRPGIAVTAEGAEVEGGVVRVRFDGAATGYVGKTVTLRW